MSRSGTDSSCNDHTPLDREIAKLAARQHDLVTHAELVGIGLSVRGISKRVERRVLHRRYRGIYSLGSAPLSRKAAFHAAVLAAGEGAVLSHMSAAELHRLSRELAPLIAVLSPWKRTLAGVWTHRYRSLDPRDVTSHVGIPVTTIHRTFVDLSDILTAHELVALIREAHFHGRFVEPAIRDSMDRANGRHNLQVLDRAIDLYKAGSAGTRSRNEVLFLGLELPEPLVNTKLLGYEADFLWPEVKLNVEVDGAQHNSLPARRADAARDRILTAEGYTVLRFPEEDVKERPDEVLRAVSAWVSNRGLQRAA